MSRRWCKVVEAECAVCAGRFIEARAGDDPADMDVGNRPLTTD